MAVGRLSFWIDGPTHRSTRNTFAVEYYAHIMREDGIGEGYYSRSVEAGAFLLFFWFMHCVREYALAFTALVISRRYHLFLNSE